MDGRLRRAPLSPDQQQTLDAAEKTFAKRTEDNILKQQTGIEKRGGKLHATTAKALEAARATLARPRPEGNTDIVGTPGKTTSSTASSSGPLPPADTATTQGVTPPAGTSSDSRTSTANADGTTVTASSGDSTAPGGSTHTTNGVAASPVGHGNRIPEDTTHPEHIDLATRRAENLGKIATKLKLNPHEQGIYDNAQRVRDHNAPAQPGDRNSPLPSDSRSAPNPQDLVMAGGDGPISQTKTAAADAPPPAAPAQPANAIGSAINGPSTANPDAPHASANDGSGSSSPTPSLPSGTSSRTSTNATSKSTPPQSTSGRAPRTTSEDSPPHSFHLADYLARSKFNNNLSLPHATGTETNQNADALRGAPQKLLGSAAKDVEGARPDHRRDDPNASEKSEIRALADFGRSAGLMLNGGQVRDLLEKNPLRRGIEHEVGVLRDVKRVIKDYDPRTMDEDTWEVFYKPTNSVFDYLTDLMLSNHLFGDDLRLEGFYEAKNQLHVVISQPFVNGKHPDWATLVGKLEDQGLVHEKPGSTQASFWVDAGPAGRLLVTDVHEDNVIINPETGRADIIDVHFSFGSREQRIQALKALGLW